MISSVFVDRPRLAIVIAFIITIAGLLARYKPQLAIHAIIIKHLLTAQAQVPAAPVVAPAAPSRPA